MCSFIHNGPIEINNKSNVSFKITISKIDSKTFCFENDKKIKIEGLTEIIKKGKGNKDNVYLDDSKKNFRYNSKNKHYYFSPIFLKDSIKNFDIVISTENLVDGFKTKNLKISFFEKGKKEEITLNVNISLKIIIEITKFKANKYIFQGKDDTLKLEYKIKDYTKKIKLLKNNVDITDNKYVTKRDGAFEIENLTPGIHNYQLQIPNNPNPVNSNVIEILVVDNSQNKKLPPPIGGWTIINFCSQQNGEFLIALLVKEIKKSNVYKVDIIQNVVNSKNWINKSEGELQNPEWEYFATSPLVHLQPNDESYGKLLFIGGSRIATLDGSRKYAKQVLIYDIDRNTVIVKKFNPIQESDNTRQLKARWGHTCVVFPIDKEDHIWMIGGKNKRGTTLNEIWVSKDGINWKYHKPNTEISKSVIASAAVQYAIEGNKRVKKALWFTGGYTKIGSSKVVTDVWRHQNNKWEKIVIQNFNKDNLKYLGIGFGGVETSNSEGMFFIMENKDKGFLYSLTTDNKNQFNLKLLSNDFNFNFYYQLGIVSAFYSESLFMMSLHDNGAEGFVFSDLQYRISNISETTINFYNK